MSSLRDKRWKLAESPAEVEKIRKLRKRIFFPNAPAVLPFWDEYDNKCLHLIVFADGKPDEVAASFRVRLLDVGHTQTDVGNYYQLDGLLSLPGKKLEVGRLCIDIKSQGIAAIVFRSLAEVARELGADLLFGCVSTPYVSWENTLGVAAAITEARQSSGAFRSLSVAARNPNWPEDRKWTGLPKGTEAHPLPGLLRFYLKAGAEILGEPSFDGDLHTMDFLMVLDLTNLSDSFRRRFS